MRPFLVLSVALLLVFAGCTTTTNPAMNTTTTTTTTAATSPHSGTTDGAERTDPFADPESDVLGWENGYWANETLAIDANDGLNDTELDAVVNRAMARVEEIRRLEFTEPVDVEVITRVEQGRRAANDSEESAEEAAWNDEIWQSLFIVDENHNTSEAFAALTGANVLGYYDPGTNELVIVTGNEARAAVDEATLIHELTHALQDQRFNLSRPELRGETQDSQLSTNGLVEGDANYVEALYERRCGGGEWVCLSSPGSSASGEVNLGLLITIYEPYSDGPVFVNDLRRSGDWRAVNAAYDAPPASTEQVIHLTDEPPVAVSVEDRSRNGWERFDAGVDGGDTVGEVSIFAMFWYATVHYGIPVVDTSGFTAVGEFDTYDYTSAPSEGWAGDQVVPYQKGDERGYVWQTEWDTERDARQFHDAYVAMLRGHGAEQRGDGVWVIPDGGYADAFSVRIDGTTVTVVNAPTVADLADIHGTDR